MNEDFHTETFEDHYEYEAQINTDLRRALDLLKEAGESHKAENISRAIELYRESLAFCPTADAHTYLGWMYSLQDRIGEAMEECHQAIEVDPDFGNPYNDIGCFLLELDQLEEAEEWFEKAKTAPRYVPRHFPYMNLARLHMSRGEYGKAFGELYQATRRAPEDGALGRQLADLASMLN